MDRQEVSIGDFSAYLKMEGKNQYEQKCKNTDRLTTFTINLKKDLWSKKPMICIDQETAKAYCSSFGKDLPTKEQWEYAAGINNGQLYPWGDEDPTTEPPKTNFGQTNSYEINTTNVDNATQDISPFGVLNMGGNVAEWTKDKQIAKGGAWNQETEYTRIEHSFKASKPNTSIGFRCIYNH